MKLPTLTYRRLRGDVINVYKYIHGIYRLPLADNMFEMALYGATRGHSFKRYFIRAAETLFFLAKW